MIGTVVFRYDSNMSIELQLQLDKFVLTSWIHDNSVTKSTNKYSHMCNLLHKATQTNMIKDNRCWLMNQYKLLYMIK